MLVCPGFIKKKRNCLISKVQLISVYHYKALNFKYINFIYLSMTIAKVNVSCHTHHKKL